MVLNHFSCFFFFCLSAPFVRACRTARARSCSPHVWRQIRERARARAAAWPFACTCSRPYFPSPLYPNHIIIRSLTLGTNISADLWQTSHHPHHHHPPFSSLPPPKHTTTSTSFPFLSFPVQSQGGDILGVTMCLFCGVFTVPQSTDDLS